ncbi:hypothetical protein BJF79_31980 [Actinomadura sp. CNU-125]|uniref:HXXEE domain-containing protein n=1 Tax=Actinomadura sp. CNU-125 TaxID=1904961 RepID=UPI0009681DF0|nr:HXXEE domain-containing protein [Actinomadura sp. CNU-125]OLT35737.1 hypothetical protein BJF79_31980 [Actinomadura sp. CNU-125]
MPVPDSRRPAPALRTLPFLLPYVVYVLHTLEELPGFAAWTSEHFGPETTGTFAAYHIPLMLLVLACSWRAMAARRNGAWVVLVTAFQWQFAVNALFHVIGWIILGDYSPGAVTGAVVSVPAAIYYFWWLRDQARATTREIVLALGIGTIIAGLAIGFLFL